MKESSVFFLYRAGQRVQNSKQIYTTPGTGEAKGEERVLYLIPFNLVFTVPHFFCSLHP